MTPDLSEQLAYLVSLTQKNPRAWWHHCLHRAKELSAQEEFADLPRMLKEAMQTASKTCIPTHESTDRKEN